MYSKISEPLSAIGNVLKEVEAGVSKPQLKKVFDKMEKAPLPLLKDLGRELAKKPMQKEVEAGAASKFVGLLGMLAALVAAAHADPAAVGRQIAQADSSVKVEQVLDSLLTKADMPTLTMRGKIDMSKVMEEINDQAFEGADPRVGPTHGTPYTGKA